MPKSCDSLTVDCFNLFVMIDVSVSFAWACEREKEGGRERVRERERERKREREPLWIILNFCFVYLYLCTKCFGFKFEFWIFEFWKIGMGITAQKPPPFSLAGFAPSILQAFRERARFELRSQPRSYFICSTPPPPPPPPPYTFLDTTAPVSQQSGLRRAGDNIIKHQHWNSCGAVQASRIRTLVPCTTAGTACTCTHVVCTTCCTQNI